MKSLVFMISIYFLFLAVMPCNCDLQNIDSIQKTEQIVVSSGDHHVEHDTCTPFCACSGFHHTNFIAKSEIVLHVDSPTLEQVSLYSNETPPSYTESLWRPPQI